MLTEPRSIRREGSAWQTSQRSMLQGGKYIECSHCLLRREEKPTKFQGHFMDPFPVIDVLENGVRVRPVDKPQDAPMRVVMDRVRCPVQLPNKFWSRRPKGSKNKDAEELDTTLVDVTYSDAAPPAKSGSWSRRSLGC